MIRLLMKSGEIIQVDRSRLGRQVFGQNQIELKDPKTGDREFIGGDYVNYIFEVLLFKNGTFNESLFNQLNSIRGQECNIEVNGTILNYNSNPFVFFVIRANPFTLGSIHQYEAMIISTGANTWSPEAAKFLIDDLNNFILTDDGQKIIIGE